MNFLGATFGTAGAGEGYGDLELQTFGSAGAGENAAVCNYKHSAPLEPEIDDCFPFYKHSAPVEPEIDDRFPFYKHSAPLEPSAVVLGPAALLPGVCRKVCTCNPALLPVHLAPGRGRI